ncbi:hypothetical protein METUNv1_02971 [Methyloversatilis universalis FAM5]|uniref:Uncharacterized protein n=1 Tax=Methyloversatilis universalis (strain ATCC BAA-1314 / DSM 25237 / JCM 13912 / CCUG 52030 / FAM5) TaxID=1000565 RepID=F5RF94_METUF|nr:hypothetical protein METUNv1_02971 [Methyloversatilis universalis FAM5]
MRTSDAEVVLLAIGHRRSGGLAARDLTGQSGQRVAPRRPGRQPRVRFTFRADVRVYVLEAEVPQG